MSTCLLITTMNRTELLVRNFQRLSELTLPDEILVINDGGDGGELHEVRQVAPAPCRVIYTHNPGNAQCSHARNVGIRNTDCDTVITCEPEMLFDTDVIAQMLGLHHAHPNDVITAGTIHHAEENPANPPRTIVGWLAPFIGLYERQWLLDIGGWDEHFPDPWGWEDTDLLTRLRWLGRGQIVDPWIIATHQWHPSRAVDQARNEAYFLAKNESDMVANKGESWGTIKTT